uniref:Neuronal PAS domain protein 4a n=1 Tax=Nothobranchius pienaari TaxID=704102 RepID=A0A1A8MQ49_9TELE
MTFWCTSCKCHVSSPCTSHHLPEEHRRAVCRRFRATKGASKARRDHINHEIRSLRALLPISQEDQERLSYLHSMAAICTYIRKSVLFHGLPAGRGSCFSVPYEAFLESLPGFILVTTAQGRLVYVSENVDEFLGLSMVDVLQGDTIYDLVERSDVEVVRSSLHTEKDSSTERSFVCSMQTSKSFKLQYGSCCSMLVRGSFQLLPHSSEPLLVALCTPTVNRLTRASSHMCHVFSSRHRPDMSFIQVSDSVSFLLGFSVEELTGHSWYSLVHPEDLALAANSHRSLIQADEGFQVEMVLRLQHSDLSWSWNYIRANRDLECYNISCTNCIISETEAKFLQKSTSSDAFRPSAAPNYPHSAQQASENQSYSSKCYKRRRTSNSQSEGMGAGMQIEPEKEINFVFRTSYQADPSPVPSGESLTLFTPPCSPTSSSSPLQQEELSHDLLVDVHECTHQLLSSPEPSPSYYPYPGGLTCLPSPTDSLPATAEQMFHQRDFDSFTTRSSLSSLSPVYNDFQACPSDARLVPDCLSMSDMCESPSECLSLHPDDFDLLQPPQGGSLGQMHHQELPIHSSFLTPHQSPMSTEPSQYNEREQEEISILAQQISSLASSFDMNHTLNLLQNVAQTAVIAPHSACTCQQHPPLFSAPLPKKQLVSDDFMFESILKDLVTRKSADSCPDSISYSYQPGLVSGSHHVDPITDDSLPGEQLHMGSTALDPFGLQLGLQNQNTGLHQPNHYFHSRLQQDELAEENLY